MYAPHVVSDGEWDQAIQALRAEERPATRERDALAALRRRLPAVAIEKPYRFHGAAGDVTLLDLFEGRHQLLLNHFMFAPTVDGWRDFNRDLGVTTDAGETFALSVFHRDGEQYDAAVAR